LHDHTLKSNLQQSDSKTAMPVASTSCGEIEMLALYKGLVQATPSTRTLELRVGDITISSVGSCAAHAQQGGCQATSLHVGTGTARPRRHFVVAAPRVQPSGS